MKATPKFVTYKVQAGDTLSKISSKHYGTPHHWKAIAEANKNTLKSIKSLKIGQELRIPKF